MAGAHRARPAGPLADAERLQAGDRGHRFTFATKPIPNAGFDGTIACRVLDIDEERLLRISWGGGGLDTTVTWRLVPEGHGTRLFIEHAGFDLDDPANEFAFRGMGSGWRTNVIRSLLRALDEFE